MKRTVSMKLNLAPEQTEQLERLQTAFANTCNMTVPLALRCRNMGQPI